jgi:RNA polymerase-interacting CarD/CdnL/TRCF family regulator
METHTPIETPDREFLPGSSVIYATLGRCHLAGTETRILDGQTIQFYKLEVRKSSSTRSSRNETAIWVPVAHAKARGLRLPMNLAEAGEAMKILASREYFFKTNEPWSALQSQLESTIRLEGGAGLAKVASFLYVLKKKQIVPTPEVLKLQEMVHKLLFRELAETLNENIRTLEERVVRGFRTKLQPDT